MMGTRIVIVAMSIGVLSACESEGATQGAPTASLSLTDTVSVSNYTLSLTPDDRGCTLDVTSDGTRLTSYALAGAEVCAFIRWGHPADETKRTEKVFATDMAGGKAVMINLDPDADGCSDQNQVVLMVENKVALLAIPTSKRLCQYEMRDAKDVWMLADPLGWAPFYDGAADECDASTDPDMCL